MTDLAARLAGLSPQQRAVLARRLQGRREEEAPPTPGPRDPGQPDVCSFAQRRLWFLEQLRPGTHAWNTPVVTTLHGSLDHGALRSALEVVIERHAPLRTVFEAPEGDPVPMVLRDPAIEIPVIDAGRVREAIRPAAVRRLVADEVRRPFDLEHDVLVRARILRLGAEEHVLVLVAHHIGCDGWSKGLLVRELCTAYDALSAGAAVRLPPLPLEYADYASWERRYLAGPGRQELVDWWRRYLAGHAPTLALPTDHERPPSQAFLGSTVPANVPRPMMERAVEVGRQEGASAFMSMLAVFVATLHMRTGQEDILVGSPSAMRNHPEIEALIGFFANTLVYRTDLSGRPPFRELLRRIRTVALGVYAHQELPFDLIVAAANPPRDLSRTPLVQVNFRLEGAEPLLALEALHNVPVPIDPGIARFDLAVEVAPTPAGLAGYLEYDTALFERHSATRFSAEFTAVCAAAGAAPDRPLADLALPPLR